MASSGAHFAKETKMIQIRCTEIFKSMSGIHFKREAMSSKTKTTYIYMYSSLIPKKLGLNHLALVPLATNHLDVLKSRDPQSKGQME